MNSNSSIKLSSTRQRLCCWRHEARQMWLLQKLEFRSEVGQKGSPPELWVGGRRLHTGKQPFIE
jgi:hypothetical protein